MSNYDIGIIGKWVKESTCNNKYHWRIAGFITHWTVKECIAQCADRGLVTRVQGLIKTWFRCWSVKMRCCELQGDYSPGIHHAIQILGTETRRTGGEGWWQPGDYYSLLGNGWCDHETREQYSGRNKHSPFSRSWIMKNYKGRDRCGFNIIFCACHPESMVVVMITIECKIFVPSVTGAGE